MRPIGRTVARGGTCNTSSALKVLHHTVLLIRYRTGYWCHPGFHTGTSVCAAFLFRTQVNYGTHTRKEGTLLNTGTYVPYQYCTYLRFSYPSNKSRCPLLFGFPMTTYRYRTKDHGYPRSVWSRTLLMQRSMGTGMCPCLECMSLHQSAVTVEAQAVRYYWYLQCIRVEMYITVLILVLVPVVQITLLYSIDESRQPVDVRVKENTEALFPRQMLVLCTGTGTTKNRKKYSHAGTRNKFATGSALEKQSGVENRHHGDGREEDESITLEERMYRYVRCLCCTTLVQRVSWVMASDKNQ